MNPLEQIKITVTPTPAPPPTPRGPLPWRERLGHYARLTRLHKPIGILLLLWPTLWALWIAGAGQPNWRITLIFIAGVVLMRSAGCAINDYADREFDAHVERTCDRPLATGAIHPREAIGVFVALSLIAFGLVLFLNWQTIALSVVGVGLAALYPFMKRFMHLPQVVLGLAFGWGIPMAFMAIQETIPPVAWWIFAANIAWTLVYDTQYAMVDRRDDLRIGVKSSAILFGDHDRAIIAALQVLVTAILIGVGVLADRGILYYAGVAWGGLFFLQQQYMIKDRQPAGCFSAFQNNNCYGTAIFIGLLLDYLVYLPV